MFLNLLNEEERVSFSALAEQMIESDGIVVGREAATLGALRGEMGIGDTEPDANADLSSLVASFTDRRSKIVVLLELVGLGYSDTSFSGTERSLVSEVARAMGVGADDLARIESWVKGHMEHVRSALVLMRE